MRLIAPPRSSSTHDSRARVFERAVSGRSGWSPLLASPAASSTRRPRRSPGRTLAWTDFSRWGAGLKTLKFSKSVNMESKTWLRSPGRFAPRPAPDAASSSDCARPAGAAVTHEASHLVVPLSEQKIDRVLERARDAMVVFGRDEYIAVERADLLQPILWYEAYCIAPLSATPARREAVG